MLRVVARLSLVSRQPIDTSYGRLVGQAIIFCGCRFYLILLLSSFFSPIRSGRKLHVCHTSAHDDCGLSANLECRSENVLHAAGWKYRTQENHQNFVICAPSHKFVRLYLRMSTVIYPQLPAATGAMSILQRLFCFSSCGAFFSPAVASKAVVPC